MTAKSRPGNPMGRERWDKNRIKNNINKYFSHIYKFQEQAVEAMRHPLNSEGWSCVAKGPQMEGDVKARSQLRSWTAAPSLG